jgi:hypothetical protein
MSFKTRPLRPLELFHLLASSQLLVRANYLDRTLVLALVLALLLVLVLVLVLILVLVLACVLAIVLKLEVQ